MATYEEIKQNLKHQLDNLTNDQIEEIKKEMDILYRTKIVHLIDSITEHESYLVKSNFVDTSLVKELVLYSMQLREKKIKELLEEEYKDVIEAFEDKGHFENEMISGTAYTKWERSKNG